jgi:hypothetical protein
VRPWTICPNCTGQRAHLFLALSKPTDEQRLRAAALERLDSMGAREYEALTRRGEAWFVTASVVDPFGNVLGIMYNPHYHEVLASIREA